MNPKYEYLKRINIMDKKIIIVVPCYNEENRIDLMHFQKYSNKNLRFLFVDDGSSDSTKELIDAAASSSEFLSSMSLEKNSGKAEAVRRGMLCAEKEFPESQWVGFLDADLATPLYEIKNIFKYHEFIYDNQADLLWGSRVFRLGSSIKRSVVRHYISRLFITLASMILKIKAYDTQCGFKFFKTELVKPLFKDKFVTKWIFDIEILMRVDSSHKIIEYPLSQWEDIQGSKIKFTDGLKAFTDLITIYKKYK